jgi:hypothetical protein
MNNIKKYKNEIFKTRIPLVKIKTTHLSYCVSLAKTQKNDVFAVV